MSQRPTLPPDSVRGAIRRFITDHAHRLGGEVLEIGTRQHNPAAWWCSNRDLASGNWLGVDMQAGPGVDQVQDIHQLPADWGGRFTGIVCSEVLEHVQRPWIAVPELARVLQPGGLMLVTVPFGFPRHAFPSDFWRFTLEGLAVLLQDAGLALEQGGYAGGHWVNINDHGEATPSCLKIERQLFAVISKPEETA